MDLLTVRSVGSFGLFHKAGLSWPHTYPNLLSIGGHTLST